ncbi:hypothetical protein CBS101457_005127 [Exobasidium rhododendri]|nr:hypothetical protein CBS101457_005127 [Exobasidium rhododendri]
MEDVDDELLALAGNGSSSSRSSTPSAPRKKRRRDAEDSDVEDSDEDADGSDEEEDLATLYPVEGIYKSDADRERLLEMPELEREDELAARRDEITKRRQKADLAAMVRNQQDAGRKKSSQSASNKKKPKKLKRASAPKKTKKKRSGDDSEEDHGDDYADPDEDDEGDEEDDEGDEEDRESSDYERTSTRRGNRSRKATGATSKQEASLSKLKKRRVKAEKRRRGQDTDEETSEDESSENDEEAQEILNRKAKERERRERDPQGVRREVKTSREEERIAQKRKYKLPDLEEVNAARLRRDHFTRLVHRPDWLSQLAGKFVRVSMQLPDPNSKKMMQVYRLAQISEASQKEKYYEVAEQYTNVYCTLLYGEEKMKGVPLSIISNSPILEAEYQRWMDRVNAMPPNKMQRQVPSKEATLDILEDLDSFIGRPYSEQDINEVLLIKKQAKEAYMNSDRNKRAMQEAAAAAVKAQSSTPTKGAPVDEQLMLEMNEKHRKADRERIAEAERRNALKRNLGPAPTTINKVNGVARISTNTTKTEAGVAPKISSLSLAATDINIDLGDF